MGISVYGALLVDVADVKHRFVGQQVQIPYQFAVFLVEYDRACAPALFEDVFVLLENFEKAFGGFFSRDGLFLHFRNAALDRFEVLELQFGVDDLFVAHRVDGAVHMRDVIVFETAQHMDDRVGFADIRKELVAETLAFRSALDQSGDVHDLDGSRDYLLRIIDLGEVDQPFVGNGDNPHIGFDRTEREVRRLCLCIRKRVEECRLADVGQSYDAAL